MRPPPLVPSVLLRALLPAEMYECVAGDLEEAWHGGSLSRLAYWRLAIASIVHCRRPRPALARSSASTDNRKVRDGIMRTLLQDLTYGGRLMRRNPTFSAAAITTLALGIGANTALFSMLNMLIFAPLPYQEPDRVAFVRGWSAEMQSGLSLPLADYVEIARRSSTLEHVASYIYWSASLTGGTTPERVQAYRVTANTFTLLGVPALLGRGFAEDESRAGTTDVVVLSHGLWQRRFGGDRGIIGRDIMLDGRPHTVVGVMPSTFEFPLFNFKGDLWVPLQLDPVAILSRRAGAGSCVAIARVRSDVTYKAAQADVDAIMHALEVDHPETNRGRGARLTEMGRLDDEQAGPAMAIVAATAGLVLLLACANVANLLLARGVARRRELALRTALGAGRFRLIRQLLSEGVLLAMAGGAAGLALAFVAISALQAALPELVRATQPNLQVLRIDITVLTYTAVLSLVTSIAFGVIPAIRAARALQDGLREGASAGGGRSTRRLRAALVVAEVALATIMLVGAGLLVRSYQQQHRIEPGFDPHQVMTVTVSLPEYRYSTPESRILFFEESRRRIASLPGVEAAGFVNVLPFSTYNRGTVFTIDGRAAPDKGREPHAAVRIVTHGYFEALRLPLRRGRLFDSRDTPRGAQVAIVNEALVRRHFNGEDPIGRQLRRGRTGSQGDPITIVGIAGDVRHDQLTEAPQPEIYFPFAQSPAAMMMLAARTSGDPDRYGEAIRAEILAVDPEQPVYHVKSLGTLVEQSLIGQSFAAALMSVFSGLALLLAAVGIYGVVSYGVSQQRSEFGVRLALGASPRDLLILVMRGGGLLLSSGVALGVLGALLAGRALANLLYGVGPTDPVTFVAVVGTLAAMGLVACWIPALRASRIEPATALRAE